MGFMGFIIFAGLLGGILWAATQIRDSIDAVKAQNERILAALERLAPPAAAPARDYGHREGEQE